MPRFLQKEHMDIKRERKKKKKYVFDEEYMCSLIMVLIEAYSIDMCQVQDE